MFGDALGQHAQCQGFRLALGFFERSGISAFQGVAIHPSTGSGRTAHVIRDSLTLFAVERGKLVGL